MAVKLLDEYCEKNLTPLKKYQLLGVTALFMAAKYEETELPRIKDYYKLV